MEKVRWGIVGPGIIAHQFAKDIEHVDNAILTAVASNNKERASSFAETYNIPYFFKGYDDLYNHPEVDAVYVATTHNYHLKNSLDAIHAGKAVLCEKPLTDNLADSIELIDAARDNNIYLMEALWTYFLPTIKKTKEWIADGKIGEILNIKCNFGYPKKFDPNHRLFNPDLSGGSLLDMGIYPVSMAWLFMQDDPSVYNVIAEKASTGVDYDVNMQLVYKDMRVSNLHSSFKYKLNNHCYIFGDKGYIDIPNFWKSKEVYLYEKDLLIDRFIDERKGLGFEFEIEAASNDILQGRLESAIMPHENSIRLQSHMQTIMKEF